MGTGAKVRGAFLYGWGHGVGSREGWGAGRAGGLATVVLIWAVGRLLLGFGYFVKHQRHVHTLYQYKCTSVLIG